jgi:hypothetical protein
MNPNIYFDWNTNNPSQTRIERARCKLCGWTLEYPYPLYQSPWVDRFKEDAYKHVCQTKSGHAAGLTLKPKIPAISSDSGYGKGPNSKSFPSAAGNVKNRGRNNERPEVSGRRLRVNCGFKCDS